MGCAQATIRVVVLCTKRTLVYTVGAFMLSSNIRVRDVDRILTLNSLAACERSLFWLKLVQKLGHWRSDGNQIALWPDMLTKNTRAPWVPSNVSVIFFVCGCVFLYRELNVIWPWAYPKFESKSTVQFTNVVVAYFGGILCEGRVPENVANRKTRFAIGNLRLLRSLSA